MSEAPEDNICLTLDNAKSDEFILKQNLDALIEHKNEEMARITQDMVSIPAALVRLKWHNRREIYPLQVKEEIYGAAIASLIARKPELTEKVMARLESHYQHLLARETATLRLTRLLADGKHRTACVTAVALDPEAVAARADAPASPLPEKDA